MKNIIGTFLLLVCSLAAKSQVETNSDSTEPKSGYAVTINGKTYSLAENDTLQIDSTLVKPSLFIKASEYKKFDKASLSFEYPRHLSFHYEPDFGLKTWTLNGNNFVIIIFEMDAQVSLAALTDQMIKKFGKKNCVVEDDQKELGGKTCDVKRLTVTIAGEKIGIECYSIVSIDFKSRFIYFQDVIDNNTHTEEYTKGFAKVAATIKFKITP